MKRVLSESVATIPLPWTIKFLFQVCEHSCKCLKNVECFIILRLWSLKGIAHNTTIEVHRFECMQNQLISMCTSKYSKCANSKY